MLAQQNLSPTTANMQQSSKQYALKCITFVVIVLNIAFFSNLFVGRLQSLKLKTSNVSSNISTNNQYVTHNYQCNDGFQIGGVNPVCLKSMKLSNYNISNKLRAAVVCLAYGLDSWVLECFEELMGIAKLFSSTIMDINDMNISFILFKGPVPLSDERTIQLHNSWKEANFSSNFTNNFVIRSISIPTPNITYPTTSCPNSGKINYLHMNAFRVKYQFEDEYIIENNFSYLWQVDSNLRLKNMPCNPFKVMIRSHALLGYWDAWIDYPSCRHNFTEIVLEYANEYNLLSGTSLSDSFMPSGGSLIFDMRFFHSVSYKHYIEMVFRTGLIYSIRLGDQVIYQYALALIAPFTDNLHLLSGWFFCHLTWGGCDVFSDLSRPTWHINDEDPFCVNKINEEQNDDFNIYQMAKYLENKWMKRRMDDTKLRNVYRKMHRRENRRKNKLK